MKAKVSFKIWALRAMSVFAVLATLVLGYGYWHSVTHASFNATVAMVDNSRDGYQQMPLAEVSFKNSAGQELARGIVDAKYNFLHLLHPDVGDCHELPKASGTSAGKSAWQECFASMSAWIPQWAEKVKMADVVYQGKTFSRIPLKVHAYNSEWYFWWIPLPHIGGKPYTYYRARIVIETDN